MPNSVEYRRLTRRLGQLRKHFLPHTFSPTGLYTDRQQDLARAFKLLAHAELEAFIEDIAWLALKKKVIEWQTLRKPSDLIICFVVCYQTGDQPEPDPNSEDGDVLPRNPRGHNAAVDRGADKVVNLAVARYRDIMANNHGIKPANLRKLLIPVGVRMPDINDDWLDKLNSFAEDRGTIAHKSSSVKTLIDPKLEYEQVRDLLPGLATLDSLVLQAAR